MNIRTKYDLGQAVWVIYEHNGEICVYDDIITEICIDKDGIGYWLKTAGDEVGEEYLILYEEQEELADKIVNLMEDIHKREENK